MALKEHLRIELNAEGSAALEAIMKATGLKRTQVINQVLAEAARRWSDDLSRLMLAGEPQAEPPRGIFADSPESAQKRVEKKAARVKPPDPRGPEIIHRGVNPDRITATGPLITLEPGKSYLLNDKHSLSDLPERAEKGLYHVSLCRMNGEMVSGEFKSAMRQRKSGRFVFEYSW